MSAAATADASAAPKPKSRKLLFILVGVVVAALLAAAGALFILKKNTAEDDGADEDEPVHATASHSRDPKTPPTFLPLDSMVVNLADAGGNRFAQLGITLQVQDAKTSEDIKAYMPSIRNGILILVSQRTAEEMLQLQGKEKLASDIVAEIAQVMDYEVDEPDARGSDDSGRKPKRRRAPPNPVQGVLFSSFIVQ